MNNFTKTKFWSTEIAKYEDIQFLNDSMLVNMETLIQSIYGPATNDFVFAGLEVVATSPASMGVKINPGFGFCLSTSLPAHNPVLTSTLAIGSSGGQARIDIIEVRKKSTDYEEESRSFKDPTTGVITYQDVNTKTKIELDAQVVAGTPGGTPVAPNHTSGWIKIAEVYVGISVTEIITANIKNLTASMPTMDNVSWTSEKKSTWLIGNAESQAGRIPLKMTTTERDSVSGIVEGTIIYNTTIAKLQQYDGATWFDLHKGYSRGQITGELLFRDGTNPAYISPGFYEVDDGTLVNVTSVKDSGASGFLGDTARPYLWYLVMMNKSGAVKLQMATGGYIGKTYTVNSITGGNTINVTGSAGGTQPAQNMIAVLEGITASGEVGFWAISSVSGSPVTSIVVLGTLTNQGASAGTVKIYYRMSSLHFGVSGAEANITDQGDTIKYTPSHGDALFSSAVVRDWSWYDPSRNGYYSKWTGYTGYRILGCILAEWIGGALKYTTVISYRSGRNKNDNLIEHTSFTIAGAPDYCRFNTPHSWTCRFWGNDYVVTDDDTNKGEITALRSIKARGSGDVRIAVDQTYKISSMNVNLMTDSRASQTLLVSAALSIGTLANMSVSDINSFGFNCDMNLNTHNKIKFQVVNSGANSTPYVNIFMMEMELL